MILYTAHNLTNCGLVYKTFFFVPLITSKLNNSQEISKKTICLQMIIKTNKRERSMKLWNNFFGIILVCSHCFEIKKGHSLLAVKLKLYFFNGNSNCWVQMLPIKSNRYKCIEIAANFEQLLPIESNYCQYEAMAADLGELLSI